MFALRRRTNLDNGRPAFVARDDIEEYYTSSLEDCAKFHCEPDADEDCFENEYVVDLIHYI